VLSDTAFGRVCLSPPFVMMGVADIVEDCCHADDATSMLLTLQSWYGHMLTCPR